MTASVVDLLGQDREEGEEEDPAPAPSPEWSKRAKIFNQDFIGPEKKLSLSLFLPSYPGLSLKRLTFLKRGSEKERAAQFRGYFSQLTQTFVGAYFPSPSFVLERKKN